MGHLVEKYNKAYFLCKDDDGQSLPYGVEGIESFLNGELRTQDKEILRHVSFSGANVLEFGFGRGETIKYIWEKGASTYIGIDFSEAACDIARDFLSNYSIVGPQIICSDAIEFLRKYVQEKKSANIAAIDVVIMLDFVEHLPRTEFHKLLETLKPILSTNAVVVVNTPDFEFDNDVIADGLNKQGMDSSDLIEETKGMHCNRFTLHSLRKFFYEIGYVPVSQGHYFIWASGNENVWNGQRSYRSCWDDAREQGSRLKGEWPSEKFETTYKVKEVAQLHHFNEGSLNGMSLYVTPSYLEYYCNGNYDDFLLKFISKYNLKGKTVFDLGAFVGVNSMQLARLVGTQGTVCAFEPNPFNLDRLKLNVSENRELSNLIKIFPFAISNTKGKAKFMLHCNVDDGVSSASYLNKAHTTLSEQQLSELGFTTVEVDMVTLDEFVNETGFLPACLKIDIEGAEHLALAGAINVLKKYQPLLLIELHSIFCAISTLKLILSLGYEIELLRIEPDGRCFVGANTVNAEDRDATVLGLKSQDDLLAEQQKLKILKVEAKFEDILQVNQSLNAELIRVRGEKLKLGAERSNLEAERSNLEAAVAENRNQYQTLSLQLDQQRELNATLQASLYYYQMLPVIRIARKIKRFFC